MDQTQKQPPEWSVKLANRIRDFRDSLDDNLFKPLFTRMLTFMENSHKYSDREYHEELIDMMRCARAITPEDYVRYADNQRQEMETLLAAMMQAGIR